MFSVYRVKELLYSNKVLQVKSILGKEEENDHGGLRIRGSVCCRRHQATGVFLTSCWKRTSVMTVMQPDDAKPHEDHLDGAIRTLDFDRSIHSNHV